MEEIKELPLEESKLLFALSNINTQYTLTLAYYIDSNLTHILVFSKKSEDYFQWKIVNSISFGGDPSNGFSKIWNYFLDNYNCHSCKCSSNVVEFDLQEFGFNKLLDGDGTYVNFDFGEENLTFYIDTPIDTIREFYNIDESVSDNEISELIEQNRSHEDYYSYYPFSVVYRVDDETDNCFYIGMSENKSGWDKGYKGSGGRWLNHLNEHPNNEYVRQVLESGFKTPGGTRDAELRHIRPYCKFNGIKYIIDKSTKCMNLTFRTQGVYYNNDVCPECGFKNHHRKTCSFYTPPKSCPICGATYGKHKRDCPEYIDPGVCPECGYSLQSRRHAPTCSQYVEPAINEIICPECGGKAGQHKKSCSKYKSPDACPECGVIKGHLSTCSHFNRNNRCPECGVLGGHLSTCSHDTRCPECGYSMQSRRHAPTCSHYKPTPVCEECGGKNNRHKKNCSQYVPSKACPECGKTNGHHTIECSHHKQRGKICPECGGKGSRHYKHCSQYVAMKPCPECGGKGKHKKTCSKFNIVICEECGGKQGIHKKICSQYVEKMRCPDCGSEMNHHKKTCPRYVEHRKFCDECGAPTNAHKKTCSHYKPPKACPECGKTYGHHTKECSHYKTRKNQQHE